jgi:hypothetical protein
MSSSAEHLGYLPLPRGNRKNILWVKKSFLYLPIVIYVAIIDRLVVFAFEKHLAGYDKQP